MNMSNGELTRILKRFALFAGIILAIFSIWFSWDGLDQTVTGNNPQYSDAAKIAGAVLAIIMTLLQFIFNTNFANLNSTLRLIGGLSYVYSIYTNFLGIQHIFGFSGVITGFVAVIMDVLPESFISWAMGEQLSGDFLGNLGKWIWGTPSQKQPVKQFNFTSEKPEREQPTPHFQKPKQGKGREFYQPKQDRSKDDTEPKINRFGMFGE